MGRSPLSWDERELRKVNPTQHQRNEYERKKELGMHPRLGWCKKGDWNGRLPKGMKGGKWNTDCDCSMPPMLEWLDKNYENQDFLVGWFQNSQVDTMMFIVPTECGGEATLYVKNNTATGKTGWWN